MAFSFVKLSNNLCKRASINAKRLLSTYYTKSHEWIKINDTKTEGVIGITEFAQDSLGDIVYCDFEQVGEELESDDIFGTIESVKAASDIHVPVSGQIIEINHDVENDCTLVNSSPMDKGWLIKICLKNNEEIDELLTRDEYNEHILSE